MSHAQLDLTPYEKFLRQSLEDEKKKLDQLNEQFGKAGRLKRMMIKRQLDLVNQNIQLLSDDLKNYESGLSWLREPSKERDETAEHLKPVPIEAITGQAKPPAPAVAQARPATTVGTRPAGSAPTVGRPPIVGQPIASQASSQQQGPSAPQQASRVGTPVIGKPVGTPVVGRPLGIPVGKPVGSPTAQAPQVGTPVGTQPQQPKKAEPEEEQKQGSEEKKSDVKSESESEPNSS